QPPRYAKKWHKGQPLSKQVKYYELPNRLHGRLQPAPRDYRYVRVDNDVLMIDTVTNVVVDVIENILR
ncbi:MAG: RcnB family protein, partial [Thiopseudomonas sp.]|nr:RcnB family protein [Thiopseudomonas sp.]